MPDFCRLNKPSEEEELQMYFKKSRPGIWQEVVTTTENHTDMDMSESTSYMKVMEDLEGEAASTYADSHNGKL